MVITIQNINYNIIYVSQKMHQLFLTCSCCNLRVFGNLKIYLSISIKTFHTKQIMA
jgi:hypothetical protein